MSDSPSFPSTSATWVAVGLVAGLSLAGIVTGSGVSHPAIWLSTLLSPATDSEDFLDMDDTPSPAESEPGKLDGATAQRLEKLERALEAAALQRTRLDETVSRLEAAVDLLQRQLDLASGTPPRVTSFTPAELLDPDSSNDAVEPAEPYRLNGPSEIEETLLQLGVDAETARSLAAATDRVQLQDLYLRRQARDQGWAAEDLRAARMASKRSVREELGDARYDLMLYASRQPNRAAIRRVMEGSEAARIGLEAGDLIRAYDGQKVFVAEDLQEQAMTGRLGEPVEVEIERYTETLTLEIPRGPLGIEISPTLGIPEVPDP